MGRDIDDMRTKAGVERAVVDLLDRGASFTSQKLPGTSCDGTPVTWPLASQWSGGPFRHVGIAELL